MVDALSYGPSFLPEKMNSTIIERVKLPSDFKPWVLRFTLIPPSTELSGSSLPTDWDLYLCDLMEVNSLIKEEKIELKEWRAWDAAVRSLLSSAPVPDSISQERAMRKVASIFLSAGSFRWERGPNGWKRHNLNSSRAAAFLHSKGTRHPLNWDFLCIALAFRHTLLVLSASTNY